MFTGKNFYADPREGKEMRYLIRRNTSSDEIPHQMRYLIR
jgi:hypothetical protein